MKIKAIFFDLDGTLLPMNQDLFINSYFTRLAAKMAKYGYEPKRLTETVWKGTVAMIKNNGLKTNEEVFWDVVTSEYGDKARKDIMLFDDFYRNEFYKIKDDCEYNAESKKIVAELKDRGYRLVLATNPLFPRIATEQRISWAGLDKNDFEICTTYENSRHSKPFLEYYEDIASELCVSPKECLMVGNDVSDDMTAEKLGMKVFLLTDCLINKKEYNISCYPQGNFTDLLNYIDSI